MPTLPDKDTGRIVCLTTRTQKHKGNLTRYWQEGISKEKIRVRLRESLSTWISSKVDFKKVLLLNMKEVKTLNLTAKRKWS